MRRLPFSSIILPIFAIFLNGCSSDAVSSVGSNNVANDETFKGGEHPDLTFDGVTDVETDASLQQIISISTYIEGDDEISYKSLLEVAADTSATNDRVLTLNALAVRAIDHKQYQRGDAATSWDDTENTNTTHNVTLSRITKPFVSLTFNADGDISAVSAYLDDKTYQISSSVNSFGAALNVKGATQNATNIGMAVDRSDVFGFDSVYMAYIGWNFSRRQADFSSSATSDNVFTNTGSIITGMETNANAFPTSNSNITFIGKGRGYYSDLGAEQSYETIFDVTADVNFSVNNITIKTRNTCKALDNADCADEDGADRLDATHDFSTEQLSFANAQKEAVNHIVDTNVSAGSLTGTLDARFYGDDVTELGGTFALADASKNIYYHGAFGSHSSNYYKLSFNEVTHVATDASLQQTVSIPKYTYIDNYEEIVIDYQSFLHVVTDTKATDNRVLTLNALMVQANDNTQYIRSNVNIAWSDENTNTIRDVELSRVTQPSVSLVFDADGDISALTAYFADKTYHITNMADSSGAVIDVTGLLETATKMAVEIDRKAVFGFDSIYMAHISWEFSRIQADISTTANSDNIFTNTGSIVTGIETEITAFPTIGADVAFTGTGRGYYSDLDAEQNYQTIFDTTAIVNFVDKNVTIKIENTCKAVDAADCADENGADRLDATHDFSTKQLSFANALKEAVNHITDTDINAGDLTGTLDARFYGAQATELGGTFALTDTDNNSYYHGVFGSQRDYIERFAVVATNHADLDPELPSPKVIPTLPHDDFAVAVLAAKDSTFIMNGFAMSAKARTTYTRDEADVNKTWANSMATITSDKSPTTITRNTGAIFEMSFDSATDTISAVTLYVDDQKHESANNTATISKDRQYSGTITNPNISGAKTIKASRKFDAKSFSNGFTSNYMASVSWELQKTASDRDDDLLQDDIYKIQGIGFAGLETPVADIPNDITGNTEFVGEGSGLYYSSGFDIATAKATQFEIEADINFAARTAQFKSTNTSAGGSDSSNLDFTTGIIDYRKDRNQIIGDVATNGGMKGTLEARFYGPADRTSKNTFISTTNIGGIFSMQDPNIVDAIYQGSFGLKTFGDNLE